jgi:hypothetical protein
MIKLDEYVLDSLMRDLVGHDRRPVSYLVYLWLAAEQQRQNKAVSIATAISLAWLIHRTQRS